ncbi:hypothetical protein ABEB36_004358 [Hypothenemus hampei]|uniref:peptidyl-tRNA hydrolase n=1 Tax=Hypothenemus hampei TaxID=57062 RepID=A0ABD1F322_HYPHA
MSEGDGNFVANPEILSVLLSMGIEENAAKEALFCTGNNSPNAAINYIFSGSTENSEAEARPASTEQENNAITNQAVEDNDEWEDEDVAYFKMIFVINTSLKMGTGKIAAQVGHACLGLYREMLENNMEADLNQWEEIGEKKIVLKGNNTEHLLELYNKAKEAKIPVYLVKDAGRTQIPKGSVTVLSLFGLEENVNTITGKLSLL